jgi:hypothetical protein
MFDTKLEDNIGCQLRDCYLVVNVIILLA